MFCNLWNSEDLRLRLCSSPTIDAQTSICFKHYVASLNIDCFASELNTFLLITFNSLCPQELTIGNIGMTILRDSSLILHLSSCKSWIPLQDFGTYCMYSGNGFQKANNLYDDYQSSFRTDHTPLF